MKIREAIILYCLKQMKSERSIYGIYHILKGKKSSQTIQDSKWYSLTFLFGIFPKLNRTYFDKVIKDFEVSGFVRLINQNMYEMTPIGAKVVSDLSTIEPFTYKHISAINHFHSNQFWLRLTLLIYSLSNLLKNKSTFLPIVRDESTQIWVKKFFKAYISERTLFSSALKEELMETLSCLKENQRDLIVLKLSGEHRIGFTNDQLVRFFNEEQDLIYVKFLFTLNEMISYIKQAKLPILTTLISNDEHTSNLTISTNKTYQLLKRNYTLEEIAAARGLKESTIEDHIVEIVLSDKDFKIEMFVSEKIIIQINDLAARLNTKKLRLIKEQLHENVSYFQIRLALAKGR